MNPRLQAALDKGHNPSICLPCGDNAGGKWIGDGRAIFRRGTCYLCHQQATCVDLSDYGWTHLQHPALAESA
jgi:hypothetical protein